MRIGDILKGQNLITDDDIDEALRRQVVHGGRFGTCIVELRRINLDCIADALAEQHGVPAATSPHFARADAAVMRRLAPELAARHRVIPLGMISRQPAQIAVASTDPLSTSAIAEIETALEAKIVPAIAPELRILYYLEIVYGIERFARFRRARTTDRQSSDSPQEPGAQKRRYLKTLSEETESLAAPTQLARIAVRRVAVFTAGALSEKSPANLATIEGGMRAIRRATGRDRVGDHVIGTLENAFDRIIRAGVIFAARDDVLIGWKGFVRDGNADAVESMAFEVGADSMFQEPFETAVPFFGPATTRPLDRLIWRALSVDEPGEVAVVPVVLRQQVVCLIYADTHRSMDAATVGGLAEIGQGLAAAFDRLVRAAER